LSNSKIAEVEGNNDLSFNLKTKN